MRFIEIGRIVKAHGVQGRMKAVHFLDDEGVLASLKEIFVAAGPEGTVRGYRIRALESRGGALFLDLEGVADRDAAGAGGTVPPAAGRPGAAARSRRILLARPDMTVRTEAGELGRITAIFPRGATTCTSAPGRTGRSSCRPSPSVREVDRAGKVMVVRLLEGL